MQNLTDTTSALGIDQDSRPPRIYAACLAAYNNGHLHGCWIDADQSVRRILHSIKNMLANSPIPDAEEWAIHDFDNFHGVQLSEYQSLTSVSAIAAFLTEYGELGAKLLAYFPGDINAARAAFEDYAGCFPTLGHFAEDLTENTGPEIPASLLYYIDWQSMGKDMELNGDIFTINLGFETLHVFWSH